MVKAVFFDIDGTLISFKTHVMPESTRRALDELKEKGIKVFVATGRSELGFKRAKEILNYDFDGYIYSNGQYVVVDGEVIRDMPIDSSDLNTVIENIKKHNIATSVSMRDKSFMTAVDDRVNSLFEYLGGTVAKVNIEPVENILTAPVYQFGAYVFEDENDLFLAGTKNLRPLRWIKWFADIIPIEGGKGHGIEAIADHMGINIDETMAFGDGENDLEMIEKVKYGIAMGNAIESLKEASDYVTEDADNDGIYKALKHFKVL